MSGQASEKVVPFPSKLQQDAIRAVDDHLRNTGLSVGQLFDFAFWFNGTPQKFQSAFITELHRRRWGARE